MSEPMDPSNTPRPDPDATVVNPAANVQWNDPIPPGGPGRPGGTTPPTGPSDSEERKWKTAFIVIAALIVVLLVIVLVVVLLNRSDDSDNASTTTTEGSSTSTSTTAGTSSTNASTTSAPNSTTTSAATTTTSANPAVNVFTASPSPAGCPGVTQVALEWTTSNATGVTIAIDGPGIYGSYPPEGRSSFPFNCDGQSHTYTIVANGNGKTATQTITVQPS